jgi:FkbM family methyltransferase
MKAWSSVKIEMVGTNYGFAFVPENTVDAHSIVYSFGAGLDLHWDVEMIRKFGCSVTIFDPTPKSIAHFNQLKEHTLNGKDFVSEMKVSYKATPEIVSKMDFKALALWNKDEQVKFFEPADATHVSHSIVNIQETGSYIEVDARRLSTIMHDLNHTHIDFLKLDIEGAEYEVIDTLVEENTNVKVMYIEFHYSTSMSAMANIQRINQSLDKIKAKGYQLVHCYKGRYFTLLKH